MGRAAPQSSTSDSAGWLDDALRRDTLAVLAEVRRSRRPAGGWPPIAAALDRVAAAVEERDRAALDEAVAGLDELIAERIALIDLTTPPPRSLRLRTGLLVHALTDGQAPPAPHGRATARPAAPAGGGLRQELVVHAFAPLDGPWAEPAYQRVRRVWAALARVLGATAPIGDPHPPVDPPATCALLPDAPIVAARQHPDRRVQAALRRESGALVLSAGWRAAPDRPAPAWAACERQWDAAAGGTGELLGTVRLYLGYGADTAFDSPPAGLFPEGLWQHDGVRIAGCALWELPPFDDHDRAERRLLALAPQERDDALSALAWSAGGGRIAPLARYLLDAARLRYELRVHAGAAGDLYGAVEGGSEAELAVLLTRLDDMAANVEIARHNMAVTVRSVGGGGTPPDGLFADDRETAEWAEATIADDGRYLRNALERGRQAARPPAPTIGVVAALPEEYEAMAVLIDGARECPVAGDRALYTCGTVPSAHPAMPHTVVLALMSDTAGNAAATAVSHLLRSFGTVDQVVMTGIAAGVPAPAYPDRHVRLGDVVVSTWGVVDYDHVVDRRGGIALRQGFPAPSALLSGRAQALAVDELRGRRPWEEALGALLARRPGFARPAPETDVLRADDRDGAPPVAHPDPALSGHRPGLPKVHQGRIGSANRSLRNAKRRDALAERYGLRAIEMEASGIGSAAFAGGREWLVVRGISDYGDRWIGTTWRRYASAAAAAYVRALLGRVPPLDPHGGRTAGVTPTG